MTQWESRVQVIDVSLVHLVGEWKGGTDGGPTYCTCTEFLVEGTLLPTAHLVLFALHRSPKAGGRSVERLSQLSSAAQRLASSKLGIRSSTDKSLRASYSPSPWRQGSDVGTPRHGGEPGTPGQVEGQNATPSRTISLTDNLLNFPAR